MTNILSNKYENLEELSKKNESFYRENTPFPHIVFENFFEKEFLKKVLDEFPDLSNISKSEKYNSKNEVKLSYNKYENFSFNTKILIDFLNSKKFLNFLKDLTSVNEQLIADPELSGGGLHQIKRGGVLKIHTDFNKHPKLNLDRRLNLLLYLNENWQESYGGQLEFWDKNMKNAVKKISPNFNKVVIFSTNDFSNHGHPEPLSCPENTSRKSIALYYFSNGRPDNEVNKNFLKNTTRFKNRKGYDEVLQKNEKFKNYLRGFKIYQFLKNIEKKYLRKKK
ncbi:MAG: 2OG-Fe(II) oxygenase [Candidatus Pelagibacter sp. TMED286]|nr:MAG: 2OG-Fe(II) oxygenase [Candidatus Pelagibacter sp. TMED286]